MTSFINIQHEAQKRKSLQKSASLNSLIDFQTMQFKGSVFFFDGIIQLTLTF